MTEQPTQGPTGTGPTGNDGGGQPPYAPYLEKFTDPNTRNVAEQVFKEWDSNTTKRFQDLHSEYQGKYGWADSLLEQYEPDDVAAAVQIAEQLQADPQGFISRLQNNLGIMEQGPDDFGPYGAEDGNEDDPYADRFSQLEQALATVVEQLQGQQSAQQQAQEDAELEKALTELKTQHGEFDEDWVLTRAMKNGGDLDKAVQEYNAWVEQVRTQALRPSPRPLGQGGGLPSSDIDPTKLNSRETRDLVTKILNEANSQ